MLDSLYKMLAAACSMSGKVFKLRLSCICFINWGTHPFSEDVPVNKKSEIAEDLAGGVILNPPLPNRTMYHID